MALHQFSPIRAVMLWPNNKYLRPETHPLVMLGMYEYVYKPLGLPVPASEEKYFADARLVYNYVMMDVLVHEPALVKVLVSTDTIVNKHEESRRRGGRRRKNEEIRTHFKSIRGTSKPHGYLHWKIVSRYYTTHIESLVVDKSVKMCSSAIQASTLQEIVPQDFLDMRQLKYSESNVEFLHALSYNLFHNNPVALFRHLSMFMEEAKPSVNLYACSFMHSLVKSARNNNTISINMMHTKIPNGLVCLGRNNKDVTAIMDRFIVMLCPYCQKPVNLAVKKKMSFGGAHKSHMFTDEFTQEVLYCVEKNKRGIFKIPLITYANGSLYSNRLCITINKNLTRVFSVTVTSYGKLSMIISDMASGDILYTPAEIDTKESDNGEIVEGWHDEVEDNFECNCLSCSPRVAEGN
ncbi:hypothetical protein RRG08_010309 [Elysia crispata]|uniref:Uncharacterized protein n=1 Tax=Elysia crispata TaxID=231223 RepID=A0AAE0XQF6_9GAST|nr:hypothetical protein RRG08_010309 [Elysia crispata]